ncbi:transport permease protein [Spirilliplanes yamanashiensis]|uniref:Transport permease protein n=2 Tax=Spirilliplanes yamanashiensis TaxID=42233 RepID=A0A8J4DHB8_9ACTN|nr:transport permease protein [Spirilliplanes yamanashiensis]
MTRTGARLLLRDPGAAFFALGFPALLVLALGAALPGFREAADDLGGLRPIDIYVPIIITMAVATCGLNTLPTYIAGYREKGVLRRLATSPVRPVTLLGAQLLVALVAMLAAVAIAVGLALAVWRVVAPAAPARLLLAFVLGTAATFAVGLVLAAVLPDARTAGGVSMLVYFPMLFFAGVWTPGPIMPDAVAAVATFTPLGALSQAMQDAWTGAPADWVPFAVLAAYTVGLTALAARLFRWR